MPPQDSKRHVQSARQSLKNTKEKLGCDIFFVIMRVADRKFRTWKKEYGDFENARAYETRLEASLVLEVLPTTWEHCIYQIKVTPGNIEAKKVRCINDDPLQYVINFEAASKEFHATEVQI
jgi:hypothetical protein